MLIRRTEESRIFQVSSNDDPLQRGRVTVLVYSMQGEIIRYWCISKPCSKLEAGELSNRAVGPYRTILYPPLSSKFLCLPRPWYLKTMYHSMTSAHGLLVGVQTKSCESATQNINMRISEAGPVTVGNLKLPDVALAFFGSHEAVPTSWSIRVS
jgi:hypothetical protein